ncbi:MAG: metallophosphoesterase [Bdellovibrionaceae bacterium]|nr:metallophosphoesterase [Bdellovibrionales bacterium]MCB9086608.1 metallophosphoesterase [Pseudobdellovibrionaceae bacterium]
MKKIKLVVSDLHLGVGRTLENGQMNSLEEFYYDEKFVEFLHFYTTGKYADYEVELVLNGDIFNFLQVDYRGHYLTVITEAVTLDKVKKIVKGHHLFFQAIRDFVKKEGNVVTYVVGNHDQGMLWPGVRAWLNETLGTTIRFKNIVYYFDGVHIEHGHMHEAANRLNPRKFFLKRNLPEPVLNLPFGSHFFVEYVLQIKHSYPHVDKIRPVDRMMRWAIFNEFWPTVKASITLIFYFLKAIITHDPRRNFPFKRILRVALERAIFPDLSESARRVLLDERVHTVIFGHTHVYQYRQWGEDMEYFNTGTWTELTSLDIASLGKITKLTYVLLEYPEDAERPRGRLKEWHGYHRIEEDVAVS